MGKPIYQMYYLIEKFIYKKLQEMPVIQGIRKFIVTLIRVL
jgi:hypothetical protein